MVLRVGCMHVFRMPSATGPRLALVLLLSFAGMRGYWCDWSGRMVEGK